MNKPFDQGTAQIGDTVRLVGDRYKSRDWACDFTHGKDYIITFVSMEELDEMPVSVVNDRGCESWLFSEDLIIIDDPVMNPSSYDDARARGDNV